MPALLETWGPILGAIVMAFVALVGGGWKVWSYFDTRKRDGKASGASQAAPKIEIPAGPLQAQTVNVGLNEEGVRRVFAEELGKSPRAAAAIVEGIEPQVIISIAARIAPGTASRDQSLIALDRAADELLELRREQAAGTNLGDVVDEAVRRILERIEFGDAQGAEAEGARAIEQWRRRKAEGERREGERREAETATGMKLASETERAAFLAGDAAAVARWIAVRLAMRAGVVGAPLEALDAAHTEWWQRGRDKGLNLDLEVAVELAEAVLRQPALLPDDRGNWNNNLGNALWTLGEREAGSARLEKAVATYWASLEERTRDRVPLDWAMTQNNLGNALAMLGEREAGTARLEEAVAAYRASLEERTRDRVPLAWAMTQNNLGNALAILGGREAGTARLQEAVAAYRAALEEWTRDRVPLDWAMTQSNLGSALTTLGEREAGTARLEEAAAAHRASLEERTRDRVPLGWAMTQNNLGNALATLGEREAGTARLEEAVAAYRASLEERTRDRVPLDWATTQNNLGSALWTLGGREAGTARLAEAVATYRTALEEWTRERVPLDWATTTLNRCLAEAMIGERQHDSAYLQGLEEQAREAQEILIGGGHAKGAERGGYVLREIARIRAALEAER